MQATESKAASHASNEKIEVERQATPIEEPLKTDVVDDDDGEVFRTQAGQAEFRTLGW